MNFKQTNKQTNSDGCQNNNKAKAFYAVRFLFTLRYLENTGMTLATNYLFFPKKRIHFVNYHFLFLATTEVSLPDNVQQSLLSPSCDAKEVVIQLKENLQLDEAALERPDPDTKTIIRSLARKAKDAKRMDVFEHLREIAPAGTTGEFFIWPTMMFLRLFFVYLFCYIYG